MKASQFFDLSNSESTQFFGRVVAGLSLDQNLMEKSWKTIMAAALALEYGIQDINGKQPRPVTQDEVN
jgi:hypothetical protein